MMAPRSTCDLFPARLFVFSCITQIFIPVDNEVESVPLSMKRKNLYDSEMNQVWLFLLSVNYTPIMHREEFTFSYCIS